MSSARISRGRCERSRRTRASRSRWRRGATASGAVQALAELSRTLRAVNDGRKAIVLLSGGWPLFRENLALARMVRCGPAEQRGCRRRRRGQPARRGGDGRRRRPDHLRRRSPTAGRTGPAVRVPADARRRQHRRRRACIRSTPAALTGSSQTRPASPNRARRAGRSAGGLRDVAAPAGRADRRRRPCQSGQVIDRRCRGCCRTCRRTTW